MWCYFNSLNVGVKLIISRHMWLEASTLESTVLESKDEKEVTCPPLVVSWL